MPALLLLLLLVATGLFPQPDDAGLLLGSRLAIAGCGLVAATIATNGHGRHLWRTLGAPLAALLLCAGFLLVQMLPVAGIANPIWATTALALDSPLSGHVTVDLGRTAEGLARVILAGATVALAGLVALDRHRAAIVLWALAGLGTATALLRLFSGGERSAAAVGAAVGMILLCASIDVIFERSAPRALGLKDIVRASAGAFLACFCALAACEFVIVAFASPPLVFVSACGTGLCVGSILFYRLRWTVATGSVLLATGLLAVGGIVVATYPAGLPLSLAFAAEPSPGPVSALLADVPWLGQGAGTLAQVAGAYHRPGAGPSGAATSAARLVIELGTPAALAAMVAALAMAAWLGRGALRRNRDAAFALAGAAVTLTLVMAAFVTDAVLDTSVMLSAAALVGLASVQSHSLRA